MLSKDKQWVLQFFLDNPEHAERALVAFVAMMSEQEASDLRTTIEQLDEMADLATRIMEEHRLLR